ncbi:hypothetical protein PHLCEN_2v8235 [Hermanssonia centrifuga]|uniref:Rhodopsin domain-containing protein n=1 Tax=Hermanssonia centrifuga TaxID=98765 RepID=A0A2R6NUA5_9APHY|nr:hypothetical protein PHLCEN_2v8235 [Hermanssonia centrifuga]
MASTFYAVIWTARLAILYSVIRIDPNPTTRKHLHRVAALFILVLLIMIAQLFWVCEPLKDPMWKLETSPQCPLDNQVAICQLVTDVLADILLIVAPLRLIRHMSAHDGTRRRLMIIFSTSIVTTIVSLVHATFIFTDAGIKVVIAALVEDTFSLIVCNLPVVVTYGFRQLGQPEEETDHTNQSTFGWKAATRRTTQTMNSDTAMDVTTVNLKDFSTSTMIANPTLTQIERYGGDAGTRTVDWPAAAVPDGLEGVERGGVKQQKSIVWITTEKLRRPDSRDDDDQDVDAK